MSNAFHLWFLPAISFLSGIASVQIDPKSKKKWVLILVMAVSAIGSVVMSAQDDKSKANQDQIITSLNKLTEKIDVTTQSTQTTVVNIAATLTTFGFSQQDVKRVEQGLKADVARSHLLPAMESKNLRSSSAPTITYYPKDVDGPKVVNALQEGGFKVTQASGAMHNADVPTNAVWSGDPVGLEQAKFVALTLVRAGVAIRYIGRIEGAAKGENIIEVGSGAKHQHDPVLSVEQIQQLSSFQ